LRVKRSARLQEPYYMPLRSLVQIQYAFSPLERIGGTLLKHCTADFDSAFKNCTFADLQKGQSARYLVTLLDLTKNDVEWLRAIKRDGERLLQDAYNVDPQTDEVSFYFHFPTGLRTTTLHMHMRVNQGRLPTDNARSYSLDSVIGALENNLSTAGLVMQRYQDGGNRLVLATRDTQLESMFTNNSAGASVSVIPNIYTHWRKFFPGFSFDRHAGTVTLRSNDQSYTIDLRKFGDKRLRDIQDIKGDKPFPHERSKLMANLKNRDTITLRTFLSANWPNWDGNGAEYLPPLY